MIRLFLAASYAWSALATIYAVSLLIAVLPTIIERVI